MNKLKMKLAEKGVSAKMLSAHLGVTENDLSIAGRAQDYVELNKLALKTLKNKSVLTISEEGK